MNQVVINNKNFNYIFHISDIHIRLYSRKEEYNYVFNKLYEIIKSHEKVKKSLIVITGDILHNKIELTPECILMTHEFLKNLGEICPTILIAGNHDALLNNRERIDSLTSILYERNPENVYYLKNSGYYKFGNIVFAVNSLLDENESNWLNIDIDTNIDKEYFKDCYKIALYHGQISGWKNNFGFTSENGDKNVSDFLSYDYILLGDIHKHQFLDKNIAYSGSLISQNFGETDDQHGILFWNLRKKTTDFIKIYNPYCFCEGILTKDFLKLLFYDLEIDWKIENELKKYIPEYCNIQVYLTEDLELNHNFLKKFKNEVPRAKILQKFYNSEKSNEKSNMTSSNNEIINDALWIRMFVLEKLEGNDIIIIEKIIKELMDQYKNNVCLFNRVNSPSWELLEIKFDDMFGYGKNNLIQLKNFYPFTVTGIFGKNSFGKSTLIDIITFLLFGKITRSNHGNSIPKEIININEKSSYGEIKFKVGNEIYKLTKSCVKQKNDKIKITEQLFLFQNEEWKNYSEEHRKKTDKVVENLLGNLESFLFTNISLQQREKQIRDMTQKERKEFLYSLFGFDWFEKYRKEKEDEYKKLKGEEKVYKEKISNEYSQRWDELSKNFEKNIKDCLVETLEISNKIDELNIIKEDLLKQQKKCSFSSKKDILLYQQKIKKSLDELIKKERTLYEEKYDILKIIDNFNLYDLQKEIDNIDNIMNELNNFNELLNQDSDEIQKWINCDKCEWETFNKKIQNYLENSEQITNKWNFEKERIENDIYKIKSKISSYNLDFVSVNEFDQLESKISKANIEIPILENKINEKIDEIPIELETEFENFNKLLQKHEIIHCSIKLLQSNLKETKNINFNKNCESCMTNPFYLKQNEIQLNLEIKENESKKIFQEINKTLIHIKKFLDFEIQNATFEKYKIFISDKILEMKKNRNEFYKKKESYQKKLDYYKNILLKFEHTKIYLKVKKDEIKILELETLLKNNNLKVQYDELLIILKNVKIYKELDNFWKNYNKNYSYNDLKNKKDKFYIKINEYESFKERLNEINDELLKCNQEKIKMDFELIKTNENLDIFNENEKITNKKIEIDSEINNYMNKKEFNSKKMHSQEIEYEKMKENKKEWDKNMKQWKITNENMKILELLIGCIDRDGLPLFLLKKFLPTIESEINQLLNTFLDRKISLKVIDKDVSIGLESKNLISNYLGGMESFVVDLSLKLVFSKFSKQPRSNFFIIDEGISVFDQERISNIGVLFNFLSSISEHVFLISHLPSIKDFVTKSIEVMKDENNKSFLTFY